MELLERYGLAAAARWLHVLFGIAWIGLLYYFNLVQVPAFAAYGDNAAARNIAIDRVARRALWWFRWAALATFVMGILITGAIEDYYVDFFQRATGVSILLGMVLGTIMFLNVWGVIWRKQKVVLANAAAGIAGQPAVAGAADAGRRALLASRQNFIFSVPMLWFMVATSHFYVSAGFDNADLSGGNVAAFLLITLAITLVLELNALGIFGTKAGQVNLWIYEKHQNAIISAFVLWAIFWLLSEALLGA